MSIIGSVKSYIAGYAGLEENAPLWVNHLASEAINYSIVPIPGKKIIETYLNGGTVREYPFSFQSTRLTSDEAERLDNLGFYEAFSDWLEQQTNNDILPDLGDGKTAWSLLATNWAFLQEEGQSDTAIYSIQCKLTYEQEP